MAKGTRPPISQVPPSDFAQVPPRDLHPVADIRLVITDVAKLTERIDNLIQRVSELKTDGKETRDKLDNVKESIDSFKGGMKIVASLYALALVLVSAFFAWFLRPAPSTAPTQPTVLDRQNPGSPAPNEKGAAEAAPK
jgi:hypothetical protein